MKSPSAAPALAKPRQIKFRVWDRLGKRYTFSDTGHQPHYMLSLSGSFVNLQNGAGGSECVVEEFIGLRDIDGKDIYEGDIVEFSDEAWSENPVNGQAEIVMVSDLTLVQAPQWGLWFLGEDDPSVCGFHPSMRGEIRVLPETSLQRRDRLTAPASEID